MKRYLDLNGVPTPKERLHAFTNHAVVLGGRRNRERYVTVMDFHSRKFDNARASQIQPGAKICLFHIGHISAYLTKYESGFVGLGEERYGD